jgi:hypothetical protein
MSVDNIFKARSRRSRDDRSQDISTLNAAIDILNAAKDVVEILPVKGILGSTSSLLTLVRVSQDLY